MISKFDATQSDHVQRIRVNGNNMPHYLGDEIQNEILDILGDNIKKSILDKLQETKYFSLISDCTPDVGHQEQLTSYSQVCDL